MDIILQVMTTANMFLLLSILILTGGMSFTNLNIVDSVLAKEPVCNLEIQSLLPCTLGSESGGSSVSASSGTVHEQKENDNNKDIDSTSIMSQVIAGKDVVSKRTSDDRRFIYYAPPYESGENEAVDNLN